jgi:transcriptional regulator with XRE-family HTH domain
MMTLGQRLRELREERDISLREFAKKLGCSAAFWSDVELGRRYTADQMLRDAARLLKVSFDDLKARDTRPPLEEVRRATAEDPRYAIAFRRVLDSKVTPEQLLKLAGDQPVQKKKP